MTEIATNSEPITKLFEVSYYVFKQVNPLRFARMTYYEADEPRDFRLYMEKGTIVKFNESFYMYGGERSYTAMIKHPSFILLTKGKRTILKIDL